MPTNTRPIRALLALAALLPALLAGPAVPPARAALGGTFDGPRWTPSPADSADFGAIRRALADAERIAAAASRDARERRRILRPLQLGADSAAAALHDRIAARSPADSVTMAQALLLRYEARSPVLGLRDSIVREVLWEGYALLERQVGPDSPSLLRALAFLVEGYHSTQNLRRAAEVGERRLAILDAMSPADSLELSDALMDITEHHTSLGDFTKAESRGARAVAVCERTGGERDGRLARALTQLANARFRQSRFAEALDGHRRALALRERTAGPGSADVAQGLHNIAATYAQMAETDSALAWGQRALAAWELPENNANASIGSTLTLLGQLRRMTGDYERARTLLERGVEIRRRANAPNSPTVAQALESLAGLLEEMGDYRAALANREESVRIRERAQGAANPDYAAALDGLARLRLAMNEPAEALPLAQRAIEVRTKALGPNNERLARMHATLGDVQRALGDPGAALASYERARAIDTASGQAEKGEHVPVLWRLGQAHLALHQPARAESALGAARALAIRTVGPAHPLTLDVTDGLAQAERALGRIGSALDHALAAERAGRELFDLQAPALSERQALRYAHVRPTGLPTAIELATRPEAAERVADVWDGLVRRRGQVLDEMADRRRAVRRAEDAVTDSLRRAWEGASRALGSLLAGGGAADPAWEKRVAAARARLEKAEAALGARSRAFRDERSRGAAGFAEVARALPEGAALVAYARYAGDDPAEGRARNGSRLAAFVLPARGAKPFVVPVGEAWTADSLARDWRAAMRPPGEGGEAEARAAGRALREAVWDPVAARLGGARRVLLVPEGELNLVNFAALPAEGGRYLAEAGPEFHLLPGERDLAEPAAPARGAGLLALGGVSFDEAAAGAPLLAAATRSGSVPGWRGPLAGCEGFRAVTFAPLPATAREVERVAAEWPAGAGEVVKLAGADATEAAVRGLAPGRRIVHLATHGFFVDPRCGSGEGGGRGIGGLAPSAPAASGPAGAPAGASATAAPADAVAAKPAAAADAGDAENPLRLSGLALAGANRRAAAGEGGDDGILTAEELAALDLAGVEWVVLSACDTGVGTLGAGEGVFGLRRALRLAGARTLIASLWAVEDQSASRWMESLYRRRLRERQDAVASVNGAMRDELARRRAAGESTHPFYWAGFVASGDWR